MDNIKVDMENLSEKEREQLIGLIKKANQKPKKRWRAEPNKEYYFVDESRNRVFTHLSVCGSFDKELYRFGNHFKTKEEAEFELNRRLVYQELKDYALEHNSTEIDWSNSENSKWTIRYEHPEGLITVGAWWYCQDLGQIYFSSKNIARDAIKTIGEDRIKKYLFGIVD